MILHLTVVSGDPSLKSDEGDPSLNSGDPSLNSSDPSLNSGEW